MTEKNNKKMRKTHSLKSAHLKKQKHNIQIMPQQENHQYLRKQLLLQSHHALFLASVAGIIVGGVLAINVLVSQTPEPASASNPSEIGTIMPPAVTVPDGYFSSASSTEIQNQAESSSSSQQVQVIMPPAVTVPDNYLSPAQPTTTQESEPTNTVPVRNTQTPSAERQSSSSSSSKPTQAEIIEQKNKEQATKNAINAQKVADLVELIRKIKVLK